MVIWLNTSLLKITKFKLRGTFYPNYHNNVVSFVHKVLCPECRSEAKQRDVPHGHATMLVLVEGSEKFEPYNKYAILVKTLFVKNSIQFWSSLSCCFSQSGLGLISWSFRSNDSRKRRNQMTLNQVTWSLVHLIKWKKINLDVETFKDTKLCKAFDMGFSATHALGSAKDYLNRLAFFKACETTLFLLIERS